MADVVHPVVIDNGSHTCKVGFGGDHEPRIAISSDADYPRDQSEMIGDELKDYNVINKFGYNTSVLNLKHPIERGVITNWDDMEKIWLHAFKELKVAPAESSVLLTEAVFNPKDNREKMAEIMFEKFNTHALCIADQTLLSLLASGRITGMSVNVGHGITQIVPVYDGSIKREAAVQWDFGGVDMTDYLTSMLTERGYSFDSPSQMETVRNIKEKCCYVALDFEQEMQTAASEKYKLPDKQDITIGNERFQTPELLFQPGLIDKGSDGIHKLIYNSIIKCDRNIRTPLFKNIILFGGSTMFKDVVYRMIIEMRSIVAPTTSFHIVAQQFRDNSMWRGGALLTSLSTFMDQCIRREEYYEHGSYILHRKYR
ncbi:actin-3-like [Octopus sinensis]|uniref:Actin-3-like n=1 Tax=Octopus sinensis TaxID=2607531 RepID=A0A7E6FRT8_9MOLL|nr:actin-3-like [Octopus sinensis]